MGGLRAVLGQWAGGGLRLPQAKAPSTEARLVILFRPEPPQWGSGSLVLRGGGWVVENGGLIAECEHALEKSAPGFVD